jgi:hypothetical protein
LHSQESHPTFPTNKYRTKPQGNAMPLLATLPAAILETILIRLAALFLTGAGGDMKAAREAAAHMLNAYHPETEDELRLAANIIGFSFQGLEALAQSAAPDLPITRILRLRGGAVSLSREAAKAERRLGQLQKARQQAAEAEIQPALARPQPKDDKPLARIQDTHTVAAAAKANKLTWTQAYQQRQRDARITASLKRAEARIAAQSNPAAQSADQPTRAADQPARAMAG